MRKAYIKRKIRKSLLLSSNDRGYTHGEDSKMERKSLVGSKVVRKLATAARVVAEDSIENRCFILLNQPKEPKNMAARLSAMKN